MCAVNKFFEFRRFVSSLLYLLFPIICFSQQLSAQRLDVQLSIGSRVKILLANKEQLQGTICGSQKEIFFVTQEGRIDTIKVSEVTRLWYRDRASKKGALIGAVSGGAALGTMITILAAVAAGEVQGETPSPLICGAVGGLLGAMGGGITGYAVGSAIPRWQLYYDATINPPLLPKAPIPEIARTRLGFAALLIGAGVDNGYAGKKGFLMERFQIGAYYHRRWILGPEAGFSLGHKNRLTYLGGIALYSFNHRIIDLYGMAGLGVYFWRQELTSLSVSFGVTAKHRWPNGISGLLEMRWHQNLQHLVIANPAFFSILPGFSISW